MDFELLYRKQFNRKGLAQYLKITEQTIERWEKTNKAPIAVIKLMQILNKELSHTETELKDFYFKNGRLFTPEHEPITAGSIRSIKYLRMTIDHLTKDKTLNNVAKRQRTATVINIKQHRNNE
ncbi:MAG: hypothetical protein COB22_08630 [Cycloclasticus sp.]|nr:MAG: hypothetical protein COB22_08630 [Cycloclasticus sp.]